MLIKPARCVRAEDKYREKRKKKDKLMQNKKIIYVMII